jgi:hypothetical protein
MSDFDDMRDVAGQAMNSGYRKWQKIPGRMFRFLLGLTLIASAVTLVGLLIFRMFFVNWVPFHEIPYKYDARTGKVERLSHTGYVITPPFVVDVEGVDGRPMQVCISAIQRVLNCKLVQFDSAGLELFLSWHGVGHYSNDGGSQENPTTFNQIMMAYAYDGSGKNYPFLHVVRELKPEEIGDSLVYTPR